MLRQRRFQFQGADPRIRMVRRRKMKIMCGQTSSSSAEPVIYRRANMLQITCFSL